VHGFKVGAYLSPHAYSVLERFQLDGQPVAAEVAARQLADIAPMVATMDAYSGDQPSFFEVTTALAFQIFAAASVDYAVIETGLGGHLDATNTISRSDKIAVITTIGLDHTDVFCPTLPRDCDAEGRNPAAGMAEHGRSKTARPELSMSSPRRPGGGDACFSSSTCRHTSALPPLDPTVPYFGCSAVVTCLSVCTDVTRPVMPFLPCA
jgi:dihydrofolate synthase/folylpolyglutamate synthase